MWKLVLALGVTVGCGSSEPPGVSFDPSDEVQLDPVWVEGNPSCTDLGYDFGYKVEPPESGTYEFSGGTVTVDIDGLVFDWSSSLSMDAVVVKGGPNSNVYTYSPEAFSNAGQAALHAPVNPETDEYYGLSHIELCFDYEVVVTKTAGASYERQYSWTIAKTASDSELVLSVGQVHDVTYTVTLTRTYADQNWRIAGTITITNPAPFAATITGVVDQFASSAVAVDCGVTFPYELAAGATLSCSYDTALAAATNGTNSVDVQTTGDVGPGSASAEVDFAQATVTEYDECATVLDSVGGALGTQCGNASYEYVHRFGPYAVCDTTDELVNTASFETNDNCTTGSASWTVDVTIPACDVGCTLTAGYWKTHSAFGPAPYDDAWLAIGEDGASTTFFLSGKTYYGVLWTPPRRGNAYYILAHAYIAAKLDVLNGASATAVATELETAEALFAAWTPAQVGKSSSLRDEMIWLAGVLDAYNNGDTGPGHCSE